MTRFKHASGAPTTFHAELVAAGISVRVANVLSNHVETAAQLSGMTSVELGSIPGIGRLAVDEVEAFLGRTSRPKIVGRDPHRERKRINVTLRMRASVRASMQAVAEENGRSLSEEIEARLERTLHNDEVMELLLDIRSRLSIHPT